MFSVPSITCGKNEAVGGIAEKKRAADLLSNLLSKSPSVAVYRVNREQLIFRATGALTSKFARGT